jgi:mono/diheme cytochrome c family protein
MNKVLLAAIGLVVIGGAAVMFWKASTPEDDLMTPTVNTMMHGAASAAPARPADQIVEAKLSSAGQMGKTVFDDNCAACHGAKAAGSENGPPLVHKIYEPSHHADFSFVRATKGGVRAHHWRFGDMAPVPGVTDKQIEWITKYVREMQRANGIM